MKAQRQKSEPSLLDKLSESFLRAFEIDFQAHGTEAIERMREKHPQHYLAIAAQLIARAEEPLGPTNFSDCQNMEDIGRKLLQQVGVSELVMTDDMIARAVAANNELVDRLEQIAQGN